MCIPSSCVPTPSHPLLHRRPLARPGVGKIGRITTAGVITEFTIPSAASSPLYIAPSPDGNLWFTDNGNNSIGRITTSGVVSAFPIPTAPSGVTGITPGPGDGSLWFTEQLGNKIGRITTAGVITEYGIPTAGSEPYAITAGPDGNIWFIESAVDANQIGRLTP